MIDFLGPIEINSLQRNIIYNESQHFSNKVVTPIWYMNHIRYSITKNIIIASVRGQACNTSRPELSSSQVPH